MLQTKFHVNGDLAGLVCTFLEQRHDVDWDLYQELCQVSANTRITFSCWWSVLERMQQRYPQANIALELGKHIRPAHLGVLGYLVLACDTTAEALQEFERYQGLLHDGDRAQATAVNGSVMISWSKDFALNHPLSDQVLVCGMVSFMRRMTGLNDLKAEEMRFAIKEPALDLSGYQALTESLKFDADRTAILFDPQYLALPVRNSDPDLKLLLERQAETMLAVLPQQEDFIQQLRPVLLKALQKSRATSAYVASQLQMSERTLFRRLQSHRLTFKQILAQMRTELAREYLSARQLTLSEIALLLGYSEQSAFNRAFKRETGLTPRQFQRQ